MFETPKTDMPKAPHTALRGDDHPRAKLTAMEAESIRQALAAGYTQQEIARHFNVSQPTVSGIKRGRCWRPQE